MFLSILSPSSRVWNSVNNLVGSRVVQKFTLVDSLEVPWQALSHNGLALGDSLHDPTNWMAVNEAEVLLELVIRRLEFKIGRNVTAQSARKITQNHTHRKTN